jgi:hypothetical protein
LLTTNDLRKNEISRRGICVLKIETLFPKPRNKPPTNFGDSVNKAWKEYYYSN